MAAKVDAEQATNTFDPKRVEKIIKKIETEFEGLKSEQMSYASKCRPYRERIGQAYEEGVGFGIPKKILKEKLKERELQRKLECIAKDFEDDDRETYEQLTQALGGYADTPLGKAATDAAKKAEAKRKAPAASKPATSDTDIAEAGVDSAPYKAGYAARKDGRGDAIPAELKGDDRDRYHNGWLAADCDMAAGNTNAERLQGGITPLKH